MRKALIVYGGWEGHEPDKMAASFSKILQAEDFEIDLSDNLKSFSDPDYLSTLDLIVPIWTMGEIESTWVNHVAEAVADGVGIAGCHGGMCDAFRKEVVWQFMTGANWVCHPGGDRVNYRIHISNTSSSLVEGIPDFSVCSEQYYLHVDPAIEVLATTRFPSEKWYHSSNKEVDMPQAWTKKWGVGRVYYNALGHNAEIFDIPEAKEMMRRGFLWAAQGKELAIRENRNGDEYRSEAKGM